MEAVILTLLGLMGSWNVAVTIWMLRQRRNGHKQGNPHSLPCEEHGRTLGRLEEAIRLASEKAEKSHREMRQDLTKTQKTVALLWYDAHPGQPEPNKG